MLLRRVDDVQNGLQAESITASLHFRLIAIIVPSPDELTSSAALANGGTSFNTSKKDLAMSDPRQNIMPVYRPPEEVFVRGEGVRMMTETGESYLDFVAGIAVTALGHAHPALVKVLQEQAGKLWHTSNMFRVPAAEELLSLIHI